jgi:hypothetical protein
MVKYREKNGSGRDYTLVDCFCGKQVYQYAFKRHCEGDTHPPAPDRDLSRIAEERKDCQRRVDEIKSQRNGFIDLLNRRLFVLAGESASTHDMFGVAVSVFNAMGLRDSASPQWREWAQDFFVELPSYYGCGPGMRLYLEHIRRMDEDHVYRRRVERARRRSNKRRRGTVLQRRTRNK